MKRFRSSQGFFYHVMEKKLLYLDFTAVAMCF